MPFYSMPDGEQLFVREYGQGQPVLVPIRSGHVELAMGSFSLSTSEKFPLYYSRVAWVWGI